MKPPETVLIDCLLEWSIEDYGIIDTVHRMIEALVAAGYEIRPKVDLHPDQQAESKV